MRSAITWTAVVLGAWVVLALVTFVDGWHALRGGSGPQRTLHHPNGLALTLAEPFEDDCCRISTTGEGFAIEERRSVRYQREASVSLVPSGPPPATPWHQARLVHGHLVHFADRCEENGNGAALCRFVAWRRCGSGVLLFRGVDYAELFSPDFERAWALVRGVSTGRLCETARAG